MKDSDAIRGVLITKFVCAECGEFLKMSYTVPEGNRYIEEEPTGSAMVEHTFAVHPCQSCMAPYKKVKEALDVVLKGVEEK